MSIYLIDYQCSEVTIHLVDLSNRLHNGLYFLLTFLYYHGGRLHHDLLGLGETLCDQKEHR